MSTEDGGGMWVYRPIIKWRVEDVFAAHKEAGIRPNPLYQAGMTRVGCMPCMQASKRDISIIADRWPEVINRLEEWEAVVSAASKRGSSTFFSTSSDSTVSRSEEVDYTTHGIRRIVEWAQTARGGRQTQLLFEAPACSSVYGLCE